jgi:hypothetical protein
MDDILDQLTPVHAFITYMAVFWVVAPCSLVDVYQRFIALMMEAARTSETLVTTKLHGATTQKTAIFVLTAVRISNPTLHNLFAKDPFQVHPSLCLQRDHLNEVSKQNDTSIFL